MDYRVQALAAAAGVTVDTVRFYQAKGLLERPRRAGKHALYGPRHLERLRRIRQLQGEGFPLAVIARILSPGARRTDAALKRALAEERGDRVLSRAELAAEAGVPEAFIEAIEGAGIVDPLGGRRTEWYRAGDVEFARAALAVLREGFPLQDLIALAIRHVDNVREVADRAIELFDRHIRRDRDGAERGAEEVVDRFKRLLPAITALVAHHFQRTLIARALARLERMGDHAGLKHALDATASGHLEIRWR